LIRTIPQLARALSQLRPFCTVPSYLTNVWDRAGSFLKKIRNDVRDLVATGLEEDIQWSRRDFAV